MHTRSRLLAAVTWWWWWAANVQQQLDLVVAHTPASAALPQRPRIVEHDHGRVLKHVRLGTLHTPCTHPAHTHTRANTHIHTNCECVGLSNAWWQPRRGGKSSAPHVHTAGLFARVYLRRNWLEAELQPRPSPKPPLPPLCKKQNGNNIKHPT